MTHIDECCRAANIPDECREQMCRLDKETDEFSVLGVAINCRDYFPAIAPCIADGRNHSNCCRARGVGGGCLSLCEGKIVRFVLQKQHFYRSFRRPRPAKYAVSFVGSLCDQFVHTTSAR